VEQGSIESSGYDVRILAESFAALPNIHTVNCSELLGAWCITDWDALAGIHVESFLHMEYAASGTTNLTIVARKVLKAIAEASMIREANGQRFSLQQISLGGMVDPFVTRRPHKSPYMLQLHTMDLSGIRAPLEDVFSQLRRIRMGICGLAFEESTATVDSDMEKIKSTLDILLSPLWTRRMEEIVLDFIDNNPPDEQ
jgi:hypothetical protein